MVLKLHSHLQKNKNKIKIYTAHILIDLPFSSHDLQLRSLFICARIHNYTYPSIPFIPIPGQFGSLGRSNSILFLVFFFSAKNKPCAFYTKINQNRPFILRLYYLLCSGKRWIFFKKKNIQTGQYYMLFYAEFIT